MSTQFGGEQNPFSQSINVGWRILNELRQILQCPPVFWIRGINIASPILEYVNMDIKAAVREVPAPDLGEEFHLPVFCTIETRRTDEKQLI